MVHQSQKKIKKKRQYFVNGEDLEHNKMEF